MQRIAILLAIGLSQAACGQGLADNSSAAMTRTIDQENDVVQIRIRAGKNTLTARLEKNATARDFAATLPLRLSLNDHASTEKVADLPRQLSTDGAPPGADPEVGDIAYYAPWGNLAIYYRDFGYSRGLVRLGRIESGAEHLSSLAGPVTIEAAE